MRSGPKETYIDIGDIRLCVWHWEGEGAPVLLLHATGFHGRCWDAVVERLPRNPVYAVDLRFHGRSGKEGKVHWPTMAADVGRVIEQLDLTGIVGVGHSIGGYLMTLLAADSTARFRAILLLDPVIMNRRRYAFVKQMEVTTKPEEHLVAQRRNKWQGPEEIVQRYANRPPFSVWDARVLQDYADYALTEPDADGMRRLQCDPLHEAEIYIRHDGGTIHEALPKVTVPAKVLRAKMPTDKDDPFDFSLSPTWPGLASELPNGTDLYLPELTHFIPMQAPLLVADHIRQALDQT